MSDQFGSDIRRYYESAIIRVDPTRPLASAPGSNWGRGVLIAVAAAIVTALIIGISSLLRPIDTPIAGTTTTTLNSTTTNPTEAETTPVGPTMILFSDGTEVGRIDDGLWPVSAYTNLFDYVLRELTGNTFGDLGATNQDRAAALGLTVGQAGEGVEVRLSLDSEAQKIAEEAISRWRNSDPELFVSVVVVDNDTGQVLAAAPGVRRTGGGMFDPERRLPAASLAQVYTTVAALEAGFALDSLWDGSSPQTFASPDWPGEWTVQNAGTSLGDVTLNEALYKAVNTVFAGVGMEIGPEPIVDTAGRLGIDLTGWEGLLVPQPSPFPHDEGIIPAESVAIGAGQIDLFDAAAMFTTLSRWGVKTRPTLIDSIADPSGRLIYQATVPTEVTVDPFVVEEVRRPLSVVPISGTAPRANLQPLLGYPVEQIGKTATAADYSVAWYVGSTDRYTAAVAVGRLDGGPLVDVVFNGQVYVRVFGGSVPAPIWAEIIAQLIENQ